MALSSVLVVDDSKVARKIVRRCMDSLGYSDAHYREAEDGQQALELLADQLPDLIVTDLNMPVMDGVAMLRRVKASPRLQHVPIVVVSSILNDARRQELRDRGVEHLVEKPVSPPDLGQAIEDALEGAAHDRS